MLNQNASIDLPPFPADGYLVGLEIQCDRCSGDPKNRMIVSVTDATVFMNCANGCGYAAAIYSEAAFGAHIEGYQLKASKLESDTISDVEPKLKLIVERK